jgi:hypothetical protein
MRAYVCTEFDALELVAFISRAMGLPSPGHDLPGGIHASASESETLRYCDPIQHPTQADAWAVPIDDAVAALPSDGHALERLTVAELARIADAVASATELDEDWTPPSFAPPL